MNFKMFLGNGVTFEKTSYKRPRFFKYLIEQPKCLVALTGQIKKPGTKPGLISYLKKIVK